MKELNILSIAGRSAWLAQSLCRQGFKVRFFDLTDELGAISAEDQDGPFLLRRKKTDRLFLSFFEDQKDLRLLEDGFSLSCPSGNLSSKSPGVLSTVENFKKDFYSYASKEATFWYDDFLRSFGKARFRLSSEWSQNPQIFDPSGEFFIRSSSNLDHNERLSMVARRGASVEKVRTSHIEDFLKEIKKSYKKWVVDLTITELKILTGSSVEELPMHLGWSRKRFQMSNPEHSLSLPKWSVWVDSFYKTWKEENYYIVIKSEDPNCLDVWSIEQVYDPQKTEESVILAKEFLDKELPMLGCTNVAPTVFGSNLNTLFPISTGYSEINDTKYMWNSPREWQGFNSDMTFNYQSDFSKWLAKNFLNEVKQHDITI